MAKVEVLYPFGGAKRGDVVEVPADKVGALRRLRWAREVEDAPPPAPAVAARPKHRKVEAVGKEPDIDVSLS